MSVIDFSVFEKDLLVEKAAALDAERAERRKKEQNQAIGVVIEKMTGILAGTYVPVNIRETSDLVISFLKGDGLVEHAELFRQFMTERPNAVHVKQLEEVWAGCGQDDQNFLFGLYYNRARNYVFDPSQEGADPLAFEWVVRSALVIMRSADAPTAFMKSFANLMIAKNKKVLQAIDRHNEAADIHNEIAEPADRIRRCTIGNVLLKVENTGVYKNPWEAIPVAVQGAMEKGDDRPAPTSNNGGKKHGGSLPSRLYAKPNRRLEEGEASPEDVDNYLAKVPPPSLSLADKMKGVAEVIGLAPAPTPEEVAKDAKAQLVAKRAAKKKAKQEAKAKGVAKLKAQNGTNGIPPAPPTDFGLPADSAQQ